MMSSNKKYLYYITGNIRDYNNIEKHLNMGFNNCIFFLNMWDKLHSPNNYGNIKGKDDTLEIDEKLLKNIIGKYEGKYKIYYKINKYSEKQFERNHPHWRMLSEYYLWSTANIEISNINFDIMIKGRFDKHKDIQDINKLNIKQNDIYNLLIRGPVGYRFLEKDVFAYNAWDIKKNFKDKGDYENEIEMYSCENFYFVGNKDDMMKLINVFGYLIKNNNVKYIEENENHLFNIDTFLRSIKSTRNKIFFTSNEVMLSYYLIKKCNFNLKEKI